MNVDRSSLRKVKSTPLAHAEQPLVPRCARLEFDPAMGPSPCAVAHDATSPVPALPLTIPGEAGTLQSHVVYLLRRYLLLLIILFHALDSFPPGWDPDAFPTFSHLASCLLFVFAPSTTIPAIDMRHPIFFFFSQVFS